MNNKISIAPVEYNSDHRTIAARNATRIEKGDAIFPVYAVVPIQRENRHEIGEEIERAVNSYDGMIEGLLYCHSYLQSRGYTDAAEIVNEHIKEAKGL